MLNRPRPNSARPVRRGGAARRHSLQAVPAPLQKKPSGEQLATEGREGCRQTSFPLLPEHAMLGSPTSREASKSFWNPQMLKAVEKRLLQKPEDEEPVLRLPPVHARPVTEDKPPPEATSQHLHPIPTRKASLTGGRPTLTGLHSVTTSLRHRKSPPMDRPNKVNKEQYY